MTDEGSDNEVDDLMELSIDDVNETESEEEAQQQVEARPTETTAPRISVVDLCDSEGSEEDEGEDEDPKPTPPALVFDLLDDEATESMDEDEGSEEEELEDDEGFDDAGEMDDLDDEEEEEAEEDDSDEDFDATFASASTASAPSPPRRASRMPTGTPSKKATPAKPTPVKARQPLRESLQQASVVYNEDEDLVKDPTTPGKKKKRALGKRILTEDEMEARDRPVGGADVRRMVRGL